MNEDENIDDPFVDEIDDGMQDNPQVQSQAQQQEQMVPMSQVMQLMGQMQRPVQQVPVQQQAPQMTEEQRAQHLKQFNLDDQFVTGFINALRPDEQSGQINPANVKTVLGSLVTGLRQEYLRGIELHGEASGKMFEQQLSPVQQFINTQRKEQAWTSFSQAYPQLTNFRQFVDMEADRLAQSGAFVPGTTQQQAFQIVANNVAQQLQAAGIKLGQGQPRQQPNQFQNNQQFPGLQPASAPAMSAMPTGLGHAGGNGQKKSRNPYFADDVWG